MFCKECGTKIPDEAQFCPYCGEVLEMEEKSPIGPPIVDNKLEDDFDIQLELVTETSVLHQGMQTKIFLQVAKNTSAPVDGAKVQLSGPPQVDIVIKLRKIHPKKTIIKIYFLISAKEPGLFTLTATLTSNAGHRIVLPIKIQVEPSKYLYIEKTLHSDETRAKTNTYSSPTQSTSDIIAVKIIFGILGAILLLAGVGVFTSGGFGSNLPLGITLAIIGVVMLAIVTKGVCCYAGCTDCGGCDCGDCDCDC